MSRGTHVYKSLKIEEPLFLGKPHGWIQWKGTDVCIDLHCSCGDQLHYDGEFLYYWRCPSCLKVWEMGTHVSVYEVQGQELTKLVGEYPEGIKEPNAPMG